MYIYIYIHIMYIYIILYIYICLYKYLRPTISQLHGTVLAFTSGCDTSPLRGHDSPPQLGSSTAMDRKALVTFAIYICICINIYIYNNNTNTNNNTNNNRPNTMWIG